MNSKLYDVLKWIQRIALPAILTLYVSVAHALGWGNVEVVVEVAGAVIVFLGTILGIDSAKWHAAQTTFSESPASSTDANGHEE